MSADAAGRSACATSQPNACEKVGSTTAPPHRNAQGNTPLNSSQTWILRSVRDKKWGRDFILPPAFWPAFFALPRASLRSLRVTPAMESGSTDPVWELAKRLA
jgi:hypothetical protein